MVMLLLTCDTKKPSTEPDIPVIIYDLTLDYEVQTPDVNGTYQSNEDTISYADYGITRVKLTAQLKDEEGIFISGQGKTQRMARPYKYFSNATPDKTNRWICAARFR